MESSLIQRRSRDMTTVTTWMIWRAATLEPTLIPIKSSRPFSAEEVRACIAWAEWEEEVWVEEEEDMADFRGGLISNLVKLLLNILL